MCSKHYFWFFVQDAKVMNEKGKMNPSAEKAQGRGLRAQGAGQRAWGAGLRAQGMVRGMLFLGAFCVKHFPKTHFLFHKGHQGGSKNTKGCGLCEKSQ
jgi:hypothetical protein